MEHGTWISRPAAAVLCLYQAEFGRGLETVDTALRKPFVAIVG